MYGDNRQAINKNNTYASTNWQIKTAVLTKATSSHHFCAQIKGRIDLCAQTQITKGNNKAIKPIKENCMWLPRQDKQTLTAVYISNEWTEILLPLATDIRRCHFLLNRTLLTVSRLVSPGWIESMKRCQIPQRESADAHTVTVH